MCPFPTCRDLLDVELIGVSPWFDKLEPPGLTKDIVATLNATKA
jgi:hypothetical protein